ncbi:MAG: L,D-transpeptidase family protein [Prevotella sp.]|nr:L,D-transpeptidase family protein [Prevotella sp.]
MLHSESRQSGAQGYRALAIAAAVTIALNISACQGKSAQPTAEEIAAQRLEQFYQQHSEEAHRLLADIVSTQPANGYADRMCHQYYADAADNTAWLWMGSPTDMPMADALDSLMHSQAQVMGFKEAYFLLSDIDSALAVMHQKDSAQNAPQAMAQAEYHLTKAYLRYAVGQRFGFTKPRQLFGEKNYDIDIDQADSAFIHYALSQLTDKQTMLSFLDSIEPQDPAYQLLKEQLTKDSTADARHRTLCNMERLRWRDKKHPEQASRRIFVNVAAQQVWAIAPDSIINMRICCGKPSTKSPLLTSEINRIEVNPEWGIPQSIIRGEVSGHAGDSAYFARRNYYVVGPRGRVNPANLSRAELASGRYAVRQRSGAGNSLGRIIFRFPNKFAVYLHDTSSPSAFNNARRTVSHGCIRLQRPMDMACFVLPNADPWFLDKIRLSMDKQPETEQGREYKRTHSGAIRLVSNTEVEPAVPVNINYFTEYPNPQTGELEVWGDPYDYDKTLLQAIKPFLRD